MEIKRDQGLIRALGPWSLAAGIVSMIVGAGIFAAPAALARALGTWAPLAILGCALAVGAVAICCAEGCSPPAVLGRLSAGSHTPNVAIITYSGAGAVLAVTGTFAELAALSALASTVLYVYMCVAAWRLKERGTALAGAPLNFRWVKPAAIIGIGSMCVMIALASPVEMLGLALLVGLSVVLYLAQARGWQARGA